MNELALTLSPVVGTLIGSLTGILVANRLTNYRIEQLEKKVEQHNSLIERTYRVEDSVKSAHHRIDDMKGFIEK